MKVVASAGREDIAVVYVAEVEAGRFIEFVEAVQPPKPRSEKWVLMVSTLFGCPVGCAMCDAGGYYHGKVSREDLFAQIDAMVLPHYPDRVIPCQQFKIQFARMGEPAFNMAVLDVLEEFPQRYKAPGFMPSLSTIAPQSTDVFFERLLDIKNRLYSGGNFQFQFSAHTSDEAARSAMIPVKKWSFAEMAEYGEHFYSTGDRKITLNFAPAKGVPLDPDALLPHFSPERFLIKLTPINPTRKSQESGLDALIDPADDTTCRAVQESFESRGYHTILSIGELSENQIGSNCGMYISRAPSAEIARNCA